MARQFSDGEGVSEYCKSIAERLVEEGHKATIVSFEDGSHFSIREEVNVVRVPLHFDGDNMFNWAMMLNTEINGAVKGACDPEEIDLIHANDWATVPGGTTLAKHLEVPLVTTVHSTENERGFNGGHAQMISELEWKAGFESQKVLATNHGTKNSLLFDLDMPEDKVEVVDPYSDGWLERMIEIYSEAETTEKTVEEPMPA
jgi:glycogen synthase